MPKEKEKMIGAWMSTAEHTAWTKFVDGLSTGGVKITGRVAVLYALKAAMLAGPEKCRAGIAKMMQGE